jgi:hypothetical protein
MDERERRGEGLPRARHDRERDYPAREAFSEGDAERSGPNAGEQDVDDADETTEMRGKHPLQPAEGPRKPAYDEPEGESGTPRS